MKAIYAAIDRGEISAWKYSPDEIPRKLYYRPIHWDGKAWFSMAEADGKVIFLIGAPGNVYELAQNTYAVFHSDLAQMLMTHFPELLDSVQIAVRPSLPSQDLNRLPQQHAAGR